MLQVCHQYSELPAAPPLPFSLRSFAKTHACILYSQKQEVLLHFALASLWWSELPHEVESHIVWWHLVNIMKISSASREFFQRLCRKVHCNPSCPHMVIRTDRQTSQSPCSPHCPMPNCSRQAPSCQRHHSSAAPLCSQPFLIPT